MIILTLLAAPVPGGELHWTYSVIMILTRGFHLYRIIALMLGRLRMDVDVAINSYNTLAQQVFSERKRWLGDGRFKATNLKEVVKSVVQDITGNPEEPLLEVGNTSVCRT